MTIWPVVEGRPKLTWSMLDALMRCHYAFTAEYRMHVPMERRFSLSLFEGSVLHGAMARFWRMRALDQGQADGGWPGGCVEKAFAEEEANQKSTWSSSKSESLARVKRAAQNVWDTLNREEMLTEAAGVEEHFGCVFGDFYLAGRYDLLVRVLKGNALVDYKYSESIGYGNRYQLFIQAIGARQVTGDLPVSAAFLYCKGEMQRLRAIRLNEREVEKFGVKLVELWEGYLQAPEDKSFDAYRCEWCNVKYHCDVYQEANPAPRRREEVPYAGYHDL